MSRIALHALIALLLLTVAAPAAELAEQKAAAKLSSATFAGLKFRGIGPALMSGRVADVAIDSQQPNTWYVAVGSGNLWKTSNAGTTWSPIFDHYGSYSIGCVTIDPSHHQTIWVGTGENVSGRHVGYGDGVYKSTDGGKDFENMGLRASEHISKMVVDPHDSQVVYVAAQGPLWSPGGERGLYKTTDGGRTWRQILSKGPYTGVTDVVLDPDHPEVLIAATHQCHRTVWALIDGGPETGIFKSVNGGDTWRELTSGLPGGDKGKIGLAMSPQRSNVVYATIELPGHKGGFWRSADQGESWSKMSDYVSGGTGPHYYQEIYADPHHFDVVYQANVQLGRTEDGGKSWQSVARSSKHVDNHVVAFHPHDSDFLLVGCDGGLYRTYDRGKTYAFYANLPVTQFYKLDVDNDFPFYNIVGGTQDNSTQYGPSRTATTSGIRNSDWRIAVGGDGHDCAIDPEDPNIVYGESQQGVLRRYDRRTGETVDIQPQPGEGEAALRYNWDAPVLISPHLHTRIYHGARRLYQSDDRGDSWRAISSDLSRQKDRLTLKMMGRVWSIDAIYDFLAMSRYGNATSISESPLQEGLIYVGTDDGLIQVTEDGGRNWRRVDRIYGIPEGTFVNDVKADRFDADTVYAALDNHKRGDLKPYLVKSTDRGRTWTSLVGDLPERHIVWRFEQDHVKKDLCFAATEFGLFFTVDGGSHWVKLSGGVPTISFRDIAIQRRDSDLVAASFGRSFFVLDDYSPLRLVSAESFREQSFQLFPVRKAFLYIPNRVLGGPKGSQGDAFYTAPNPPFGAVISYYLRDSLKTRKQQRHEKEAKIDKQGGDVPFPGWDAIKAEQREEATVLLLTIKDDAGNVVNRITGPTSAGLHRVAWDLRYPRLSTVSSRSGRSGSSGGPLVVPGTYTVSVTLRAGEETKPLGDPQSLEVVPIGNPSVPIQDRRAVLKFQQDVGQLQRTAVGAAGKAREALERVTRIRQVIQQTPTIDIAMLDQARTLQLHLTDALESLAGDRIRAGWGEAVPPSIMGRIQNALAGSLDSTYGPTATHRASYAIAKKALPKVVDQIRTLIDKDLKALQQKVDKAGAAWIPGAPIPENE